MESKGTDLHLTNRSRSPLIWKYETQPGWWGILQYRKDWRLVIGVRIYVYTYIHHECPRRRFPGVHGTPQYEYVDQTSPMRATEVNIMYNTSVFGEKKSRIFIYTVQIRLERSFANLLNWCGQWRSISCVCADEEYNVKVYCFHAWKKFDGICITLIAMDSFEWHVTPEHIRNIFHLRKKHAAELVGLRNFAEKCVYYE